MTDVVRVVGSDRCRIRMEAREGDEPAGPCTTESDIDDSHADPTVLGL